MEKEGFCINPSKNLISNIGFGNDALHTKNNEDPLSNLQTYDIKEIIHPKKVEFNWEAIDFIYQYIYGINLKEGLESFKKELNEKNLILKQEVQQKDIAINQKDQEVQKRDAIINTRDNQVAQKEEIISNLQSSKSFQLGGLFFRSIKKPYKLITFPVNLIRIFIR
ncbi:MAG: hypothetical protein KAT32_04300 [Candidatus Moranbacteria bacterium]|nr:hypothetical protein [Candidatus Moranbacteria bacterium]